MHQPAILGVSLLLILFLSFSNHTFKLSRSRFVHIRDLCPLLSMLDFKTSSTIATSIAHSKLVSNATPSFSTSNPSKLSVCSLFKTCLHRLLPERPGITISLVPILKSLRWLKIPERIHFRVMLLTYNSLQYSNHPANPFYQAVLLSQSFSTPVTCHLILSNRAMSITALRLWNDLPPEIRTFFYSSVIIANQSSSSGFLYLSASQPVCRGGRSEPRPNVGKQKFSMRCFNEIFNCHCKHLIS